MVVPSSNKNLSPAVVPPFIFDTFLHRPTPIVSIFKDILNYLFHRRPIGLIELFRIQPHCQLWNQDLMEIFGMKNSKKDLKNMHSVKLQLCIRNLSCWSLGIGSSLCVRHSPSQMLISWSCNYILEFVHADCQGKVPVYGSGNLLCKF